MNITLLSIHVHKQLSALYGECRTCLAEGHSVRISMVFYCGGTDSLLVLEVFGVLNYFKKL